MSTDYTQTLKTIKEAEEASGRAVEDKKKLLAQQLEKAQEEANRAVADARAEAEAFVSSEVGKARSVAEEDENRLVAATARDAENIAHRKLDSAAFKKIIEDILLSEFKGA